MIGDRWHIWFSEVVVAPDREIIPDKSKGISCDVTLNVFQNFTQKDTSSGSDQFQTLLNCYILSCYGEPETSDAF